MNAKLLQEIGLSEGETKVYLTLLKLGPSKTGIIAKESEVSSSKVYKILDRLEKKGLAGHGIIGKIKHYKAMEPKTLLKYIEDKKKELNKKEKEIETIIPELELQQELGKKKTSATMYEGIQSIKNFFNSILDNLKPGEEYYVIGATYGKGHESIKPFFQNFHTRRAKKKIKVNMLANAEERGKLMPATFKNADVRYLPKYLMSNMDVTFYKNKTLIFFLTENVKGFLIEDPEVTESFKKYFNTFWKIGEK